ncbi:MAG: TonB-dependent receptor [Bacteroidota bacterium]
MTQPYKIIWMVLLLIASHTAWAQQQTVTGTVTDFDTEDPLPGVNIIRAGTAEGTITDIEGKFSISAASDDTLIFSFVSYESEKFVVGNQTNVNIQMLPSVTSLTEIVVVGYGEQEAGDVTGVVTAVDAEEFNRGAIVSPDQLITGKVAGVQITPNTGAPGGQSSIRIRGGTSINASNEPLYVIDGVPIDNAPHDPGGFSKGKNPLNFLNPNDIESFTVLKDASAAAIYGSRGANGVIIITTKKGNAGGEGSISYDTWYSIANPVNQVDVLTASEFRSVVNEQASDRSDRLLNANTDWQDQILQSAVGQNHALSFSGGSENVGYRASIGYLNQEGIIKTSETERVSLSFNYNHSMLNDQLKVNANIKGSRTEDRFSPDEAIGNAVSFAPTQPIFDASSPWGGYWEWPEDLGTKNPVSELMQTQDFGQNLRSIGNIEFDYKLPLPGLSARLNLGYDVASGERRRFLPSTLRSQYSTQGEIRTENFTRSSSLLEAYLNYSRDLQSILSTLDVTGGYSYQNFNSAFPGFLATELSTNILGSANPAPAGESQVFNSILENRLISFFGRANLSVQDKYLLTVTVRRDGSSRFGPSNRWGTFPSAAIGWRLIEEDFLVGLNSIFTDLKLRAGWGITGNQEIGDYLYLQTYTFGDSRAQIPFGDRFITTLRPNGADPNLKWEETESLNIGLDYGMFNGRLSGSIEYYRKTTEDLLFEITVPSGANLTNRILTNIGSVENEGVELVINGFILDKENFSWNVGFNAAFNRNEITSLAGAENPDFLGFPTGGISGGVGNNIQILQVGQPVNSFFIFNHLMQNGVPLADGVDHNGDGNVNLTDIYENTNGDEQVNDTDKVPFENPAPDVILGFTSQMYMGNFDLSFTLRSNLGNYVYNNVASNFGNYSRVISDIVPANMTSDVLATNFVEPQLFSEYYVENASFLRMDNITLGYSLNQLSEKLNIRLYGTAQNLFLITNYSGLDPELGIGGIDNNIYPRARTFIVGLNIGL